MNACAGPSPLDPGSTQMNSPQAEAELSNPFWSALTTNHSGFAMGDTLALRFPPDVLPFAAVETISPDSLTALHALMNPGEAVYLTGDLPILEPYQLTLDRTLAGWQMHSSPPQPSASTQTQEIRPLTIADAPAMVALTDVAFPGFFRPRTCLLGRYFGIHHQGELIAMAGERSAFGPFRELSAVCTHPAHTGRGHAAQLIKHLLHVQAAAGERSLLHVTQSNHRAIALYERLGFVKTSSINFNSIKRLQS